MNFNIIDHRIGLHSKICDELTNLYAKKNHSYGDSFHKIYLYEGMAMPRIYLEDKLNQFKNLTRLVEGEEAVQDEKIRDTLLDLANYAIMTVMEIDQGVAELKDRMTSVQGTLTANPASSYYKSYKE